MYLKRTAITSVGILILLVFSLAEAPMQAYAPASVYNETSGVWETSENVTVPAIRPTNVTPTLTQKVIPNVTPTVTPNVTPNVTQKVTPDETVIWPLIPITGPIKIDQPGTYRVMNDFTANETGIEVQSSSVVIDGNGHTISAGKGGTGEQVGVDANDHHVTIRNLTVVKFDIGMDGSISATGCTFRDNGEGWQVLDETGDVRYSQFENNDVAISLENSGWCHIIGNRLIGNSEGIYIEPGIWTGGHVITDNYFGNLNNASDISFSPVFSILENTFDRNFWGSPPGQGYSNLCTDSNKDGFCDAPYRLADLNIDLHPIKAPSIVDSSVTPQPTQTPTVTPTITPTAKIPPGQENRIAVLPGQEKNLTPTPTVDPVDGHGIIPPLQTPNGTPNVTPVEPVVSNVTPNVTPTVTPTVTPNITPNVTPTVTPTVTPNITPNVTPTVTANVTPNFTPTVTPSVTPNVTNATSAGNAANTTNAVDDTLGLVKESTSPFQVFENVPGLSLLHDLWGTIIDMAYWITYTYPEETIGFVRWFLGGS